MSDDAPKQDKIAAVPRRSLLAGAVGAVASGPAWARADQGLGGKHPGLTGIPPDSVARFGALGTGQSGVADQAGLERAIRAANASGHYVAGIGASYWAHPQNGLFIPAGVYDAGHLRITGNNTPFPALSIWAIPGSVVIRVPEGQYLFEADERLNWLYMSGITIVGGKGAFRDSFTGINVNGRFVFDRCVFDNYTECAIGNNARDQPYLEVRGCTFMASEGSRAIGIAWGGYADGCVIEGNAFLRNRFHLKLGPDPSGSIHVLRNDFLRWDKTTPLDAAIWLVPASERGRFDANAGWGTIISGNKFGNENMGARDIRLLVAREAPGTDRQRREPQERFDPGGADGAFLAGITIENNRIVGAGDVSSPFMRSWIAEVRNLSYLNNRHEGGAHSRLCEFMGPRAGDYASLTWTIRIDQADTILGSLPFTVGIANAPIGPQWDPSAAAQAAEETILPSTGGDDTSFIPLAAADHPRAFVPSGAGVTLQPVPDHAGHLRAVEIAASGPVSATSGIAGPLVGARPGRQGWIALDLRGSEGGTEAVELRIVDPLTGAIARKLRYVVPDEWRRVRVPFTLPASKNSPTWHYQVAVAPGQDSIGGKERRALFQIARLYAYHGREPRSDGHIATLGDGRWDGAHLVMGTTHVWEEGGALYLKTGDAPLGPTDGRRLG